MRRIIGTAALLLVASGAVACSSDGGSPSTPSSSSSCIGSATIDKLHDGMTLDELTQLFGNDGEPYASGDGWQNIGFGSECGRDHEVGVLVVQKRGEWVLKCEGTCAL